MRIAPFSLGDMAQSVAINWLVEICPLEKRKNCVFLAVVEEIGWMVRVLVALLLVHKNSPLCLLNFKFTHLYVVPHF